MVIRNTALALATIFCVASAHADAGGAGARSIEPPLAAPAYETRLPSDFGVVSIEASRRSIEARIQDWQDDAREISGSKSLHCFMAGFSASLVGGLSLPSVTLLRGLPGYLGPRGRGASAPLHGPLAWLARTVSLTAGEQATLQRLMASDVQDRADQIRVVIDTQWFLMRVSNRLYEEKIAYHVGRTSGFVGALRYDTETCAALTYRTERDRELEKAAQRVLAFYYFLERELAD